MTHTEDGLREAKEKHESWLAQQQGYNGSGIGLSRGGSPAIKIYTNRMSPSTKDLIREQLRDLPIEFEETGEFKAF